MCTSSYDANEFTASDMCLACGGGVAMSTNTWYEGAETCDDSMYDGRTDSYGLSCSYFETYPSYCTDSLTTDSDFTASEMCCACGGGGHVAPERLCVNTDQGEVNSD